MNVRERQTLVEKPWLDHDDGNNNPLDLRTWVSSTTFGKENSTTNDDDGGSSGDARHRSGSRKQRMRETFHLMKMQEFKEKQKRLQDLEGASERWKQKLKDKEEEDARRKQEYEDRKAAAKEARLQAKREKKLQEKKEAKLQAKRAERARQKAARKEAARKAKIEEAARKAEIEEAARKAEIEAREKEIQRIEEDAAANIYEDDDAGIEYVEEVVEEEVEEEETEVVEEEILDWADTDDGSSDDCDSFCVDSSVEDLDETEYLELEESAFFEYLAAEEEKRIAEEAAALERIRLEEEKAAEREARLTEAERIELEAIKAAEEEQNRIMAEEEERLRSEKTLRLTALEKALKLAKEKAELESKLSDEEAERRKKEAKLRAKKKDFLDVSQHLQEKLIFKPPKTWEEVEGTCLEEEKVPERQIGEVPPSLKAMIVAASLELRPVPKEHKKTFRPIASDAASMGRLTRLKENVIEKWGEKEMDIAKGESKTKVLAKPRGMRRKNRSLSKKVSQSEKILHEAAALGRMRGRKQAVISKYGEQGSRNVEDEESDDDKEIDDLRDEHGARVFRTEYLADRHMDVRRSIIERNDWLDDLEEDDPMDSEHVELPCEEAPKFKPEKTKKSSLDLKEQLAQGVAEGYWNRYSRLERPGARLRMTEGCQCKYCIHPSEAQTQAYQKKWADKKLEGIFADPEDINPEEDRHGWLTGLFLPPEPEPEPEQANPEPDSQLERTMEEEQDDGDEVADGENKEEEEIVFEQDRFSNIPSHHLNDDNIFQEETNGRIVEASLNNGSIEGVELADEFDDKVADNFDDEGPFAEDNPGDQENSRQIKYPLIETNKLEKNGSIDQDAGTHWSPPKEDQLKPDDSQGTGTPPKADGFDDYLCDQASTDDFDDDVCDQASTDDFDDYFCDQDSTSPSLPPMSTKLDGAEENMRGQESAPHILPPNPVGTSVPLTEDNSSGEEGKSSKTNTGDDHNKKNSRLWGWLKGISNSIGEKRKESSRNRRKQKRQQQNQKRKGR